MELVRAERSLVWVCWREAGLFQQDERTVPCLCCAALSILCKNAKAGEPVSGNFHFLYASAQREPVLQGDRSGPGEWGAQQLLLHQELGHVGFQRALMNSATV